MKINANELLLINRKNLRFGNAGQDVETKTSEPTAPVAPEATIKALKAKAQNNIAFQGLALSKSASKAITGIMVAAAGFMAASCTEGTNIKLPDKEVIINNSTTVTNDFSALTALVEAMKSYGTINEEQWKIFNENFINFYKDWQKSEAEDAKFYEAVIAYMMNDEANQQKIIDHMVKGGISVEDAKKFLKSIDDRLAKKEITEAQAYKELMNMLNTINDNIKNGFSNLFNEILALRADMNKNHAESMAAKKEDAEWMAKLYIQGKANGEALDSLLASNKRQETIDNKQLKNSEKILAVLNDSTKLQSFMDSIQIMHADDRAYWTTTFQKLGIDFEAAIKELNRDFRKGQQALIGAVNYNSKLTKESTSAQKEANAKLTVLIKKYPNFKPEEFEKLLATYSKEVINAINNNTDSNTMYNEKLVAEIQDLNKKVDAVYAKMDTIVGNFGKYADETSRYNKYYQASFAEALSKLDKTLDLFKKGNSLQDQTLDEIKVYHKASLSYLKQLTAGQDSLISIGSQIVNNGNGDMTIEEFKAYMQERDAKNFEIVEKYMIETGLNKLPADVTKLVVLVEAIKNDKTESINYSEQFGTIISLLGDLKKLKETDPNYEPLLKEISDKISKLKCDCEHSNEGILGDLLKAAKLKKSLKP